MIVPDFWAEGRRQEKIAGRQVTVRRFGWSDVSQEEAQRLADERVNEAFARIIAGEDLARRERKVAYNGAEGVPIREEVVARHGETVITRNGYGSLCLNTPDVLFADIDFNTEPSCLIFFGVWLNYTLGSLALGIWLRSWLIGVVAGVVSLFLALMTASFLKFLYISFRGGDELLAWRRLERFVERHIEWRLRLYRTPLGMRVLAMHRTFSPRDPTVTEFFSAVGVDPIFARMCWNQNCFRARVSPKPWRIGIERHIRPGGWPPNPTYLPARREWIQEYNKAAVNYASCRFIGEIGTGANDKAVLEVQRLHDDLSQAISDLPIA